MQIEWFEKEIHSIIRESIDSLFGGRTVAGDAKAKQTDVENSKGRHCLGRISFLPKT